MRSIKVITVLFLIIVVNQSYAQVGTIFPSITGESLKNKMVELPASSKGKYCLVGMSSSQNAEADLQTWMQPVYDMFISQNTFIPIDYNLEMYFIPMFKTGQQTAYNMVFNKTKEEIDSELAPHVLFYKGSIKEYETKLQLLDKSKPYFFVVDAIGKIVYVTSGAYTEKKLEKIESLIPQE
jgi:hypothetical protein